MILHFDLAEVRRLLEHTQAATEHRMLNDDPATAVPGLWLIGNEGVYLVSNGSPPLNHNNGINPVLVYADEVNPTKLDFDTWWANKHNSYGGDDSMDFLPADGPDGLAAALATYPPDMRFELDVTPEEISVRSVQSAPLKPSRPSRPSGRPPSRPRPPR